MFEILIPGLILGGFALISSTGLYIASKKFYVYEDPRIGEVTEMLPGANCGGCGFAGCAAYAEYAVNENSLSKTCPVADDETMSQIGALLGLAAEAGEKKVASLMCKGTSQNWIIKALKIAGLPPWMRIQVKPVHLPVWD